MSKRLLLIVNPISGSGSKAELVPKLEAKLADKGFMVTTRFTAGPGDATRMAQDALSMGYDVVGACGGDGTVNEVAMALCGTCMPLAILPCGSGNGLARHLGIVPDALSAINVIRDENIIDCDYGLANGEKFFCTFGLGFDGMVAKRFAESGHRGLVSYLKNAISVFTAYRPLEYTLRVDGSEPFVRKAYMLACCNASQYGNNVFVAPNASITDGLLDIIILQDANHLQTLIAGLDMLTGMLPYNKQVEIIRAKSIQIECSEPTAAHIDGEPIMVTDKVDIDIVPGQLRVYGQISTKGFTPFVTPIDYVGRDITAALSKLLN